VLLCGCTDRPRQMGLSKTTPRFFGFGGSKTQASRTYGSGAGTASSVIPAPSPAPVDAPAASDDKSVDQDAALVRIQAIQKGKQARQQVTQKKEEKAQGNAATKMQALHRGRRARADVKHVSVEEGSSSKSPADVVNKLCAMLSAQMTSILMLPARCIPARKQPALSPELTAKVTEMFHTIDADSNGKLSKDEAIAFWGRNFAKVNAQAMFNEVDQAHNEEISLADWIAFWANVMAQGTYTEEDVIEELDSMMKGGSWVDWNDGRTT